MIQQLAVAQGLSGELDALIALREGIGVRDEWDLLRLPSSLRGGLLGLSGEARADLERGLVALEQRIAESPPDQRGLLAVAFNLRQRFGVRVWEDRMVTTVDDSPEVRATVGLHTDLAMLQLLMRSRPAAEAVPAPQTHQSRPRRRGPVESFFCEDYVTNSVQFRAAWETATTVDMWGFGHNRMAVSYSSQMVSILSGGGRLRVLIQDPEGPGVIEANQRSSTPKASDEAVRFQHRAGVVTLQSVSECAHGQPDGMQIRCFDGMPPFTAYFFDGDSPQGQAYIWFWSWRQPSSFRPGFRVERAADELWFLRFFGQFESLWAECADNVIPSGGLS